MIQTTKRTGVFEVTFIPDGRSEPETHHLPPDQFGPDQPNPHEVADEIVTEYFTQGEPLSVIYVTEEGRNVNLWGNRRY